MNMTLKEIFEKKELYQGKELKHYEHNLNLPCLIDFSLPPR